MFAHLNTINQRPQPWSAYTAEELWTEPHTAQQMLQYHLNEDVALASRTRETIERSVAWIDRRFGLGNGLRVADFGCGPGLYANRFARLGAQVTGVDFSANSLAHARKTAAAEGLQVDFRQQNYLDFACDQRFDLITLIMCDFCPLSPAQRRQLLGIFRDHLAQDGRILLDVCTLPVFEQRQEQAIYEHNQLHGFWSADDYYGFVNTFKYDAEKVVLDKYTLVEAHRTRDVYNWMQYFSRDSLQAEFAENGLAIEEVYADVTGAEWSEDAPEMAVVARKSH